MMTTAAAAAVATTTTEHPVQIITGSIKVHFLEVEEIHVFRHCTLAVE